MTFYEITDKDKHLIDLAYEKLIANYDSITYYHTVGAALVCSDGTIFTGVNCDGIHGSCAEIVTIGAAVTAGKKDYDTIVAVRQKAPNRVVSPCGNCRQVMFEYCPDIKVILNDDDGKLIKVCVRDLLPFAYTEIPD